MIPAFGAPRFRPKVFISYSHLDARYRDGLERHLSLYERTGKIERWDDTELKPGDEWRKKIQEAMEACDIAILLLSVNFLHSRFIIEEELPALLEKSKEKRVIPLYVTSISTATLPKQLLDLQSLNTDDRPLSKLKEAEGEWEDVFKRLIDFVNLLVERGPKKIRSTPKIGPEASKYCNRSSQVADFRLFIRTHFGMESSKPLAVFLSGARRENPTTLLNVLIQTYLQNHISSLTGEDRMGLGPQTWIDWPKPSSFQEAKKRFLLNLFSKFETFYDCEETAMNFCSLPMVAGLPNIVLCHQLHEDEWSGTLSNLLDWYVRDFISELGSIPGAPRVILFFVVITGETSWARKLFGNLTSRGGGLKGDLEVLSRKASPHVPSVILPELAPVSLADLMDWFAKYGQDDLIMMRKEDCVQEVFGKARRQSMDVVEKALFKLCVPLN